MITARITRLAGAILLETGETYFLIGNTKEPCNWAEAGFLAPEKIDAVHHPFLPLTPVRAVQVGAPCIRMECGIPPAGLAELIAARFVIARNGSVSDRLWRLVTGETDLTASGHKQDIDGTWLAALPDSIWGIVRDAVLRCV